ncbi:MAG: hypothetical protein U5L01_11360 [Rheinheimera sp.]|nr:hypothetical protein [Rheinheimera sp.]
MITRPWQTFTGIELSTTSEQCLRIRSPYLGVEWHDTTDYVDVLDKQHFYYMAGLTALLNSRKNVWH